MQYDFVRSRCNISGKLLETGLAQQVTWQRQVGRQGNDHFIPSDVVINRVGLPRQIMGDLVDQRDEPPAGQRQIAPTFAIEARCDEDCPAGAMVASDNRGAVGSVGIRGEDFGSFTGSAPQRRSTLTVASSPKPPS